MGRSAEQLIGKISKHPKLMDRVNRLLDIVDNADGKATLADDAEARVICELRELGKEMLEEWAKDESQRREESVLNSGVAVKKKTKKNSIGIRPMEPST
jgi:hypothetical protein